MLLRIFSNKRSSVSLQTNPLSFFAVWGLPQLFLLISFTRPSGKPTKRYATDEDKNVEATSLSIVRSKPRCFESLVYGSM